MVWLWSVSPLSIGAFPESLLSYSLLPSAPTGLPPLLCPHPTLCHLIAPACAVAPASKTLLLPTDPCLAACFLVFRSWLKHHFLQGDLLASPHPDCVATVPVHSVSGNCSCAIIVTRLISLCHWTVKSMRAKTVTILFTFIFL